LEIGNFDRAVLITGDGDFEPLAEVLISISKLEKIIAANIPSCSFIYQKYFKEYLEFVTGIHGVLRKNAAS
jgi:hypothetical protein